MVGRASSSIGLITAAVFMVIVGYLLTLNVYQDMGAYVIFYEGRYYGGIACMIVGSTLFFAGFLLPIIWPTVKTRKKPSPTKEKPLEPKNGQIPRVSHLPQLSVARSVKAKIRGVSMQTTCGVEAIEILKTLLEQSGPGGCDLSSITKICVNEDKERKAMNLLLNLGLIEKRYFGAGETYAIPTELEPYVSKSISLAS
jgi:hypothetical protein